MARQHKLTIKQATNSRGLNFVALKKVLREKWKLPKLKKFLASRNSIFLIAKKEDVECGAIFAIFQQSHNSAPSTVLLQGVAVSPEFRRQGIASEMLETLRRISKRMGAGKIVVITNAGNHAALELYKKTGAEGPDATKVVFEYSL